MEFATTEAFSGAPITWTPLSLWVVFGGLLAILGVPRRWVLPLFLFLVVFVSMGLQLNILGQNFVPLRLLVCFGWFRVLARREFHGFSLTSMDKAFLAFACVMVLAETLQTGGAGFFYAVANSVVDAFATYLLFRILLGNEADVRRAIFTLGLICLILAPSMLVEYFTGKNWLTVLGAVQDIPVSRKGRPRCAGPFNIAITAGTFGAILLPLFIACWWQRGALKKLAIPGVIASTIITMTSGSASPLSTYIIGIAGFAAWPFRRSMRKIRWCVFFALIGLHFVMHAPVWALIMRIQIVPGASAYHRFNVLDTFIRRIGDWWLWGVGSTSSWGWEIDDVANQYCVVAKHGGLLALILFGRIIWLALKEAGAARAQAEDNRSAEVMIWGIGVVLFAQAAAFMGIAYFDQVRVLLYLTLAIGAAAGAFVPVPEASPEDVEVLDEKEGYPEGLSSAMPARHS